MGNNRTLETLQQMLNDYRSTQGITDRIVLDEIIRTYLINRNHTK